MPACLGKKAAQLIKLGIVFPYCPPHIIVFHLNIDKKYFFRLY